MIAKVDFMVFSSLQSTYIVLSFCLVLLSLVPRASISRLSSSYHLKTKSGLTSTSSKVPACLPAFFFFFSSSVRVSHLSKVSKDDLSEGGKPAQVLQPSIVSVRHSGLDVHGWWWCTWLVQPFTPSPLSMALAKDQKKNPPRTHHTVYHQERLQMTRERTRGLEVSTWNRWTLLAHFFPILFSLLFFFSFFSFFSFYKTNPRFHQLRSFSTVLL